MTAAYLTAALVLAALLPLLDIAGQLHLHRTPASRAVLGPTVATKGGVRQRFRWAAPNWRHTTALAAHYDFGGKVVRLPAAPRVTVEELLVVAA